MAELTEKTGSAVEELQAARRRMCFLLDRGEDAGGLAEFHSEAMDGYFLKTVQESEAGRGLFRRGRHFAFIAVGGYGRRELCLESDIDLLILFDGRVPEQAGALAEDTLFPLWDLGLDLGYAVRSLSDCTALAMNDHEVLTSLMDARFLCGDSPLYLALMERFEKKVLKKQGASHVSWLRKRNAIREEGLGDSGHPMEPQLKDGSGGLRDYHSVIWYSRVLFPVRDPRDLEFSGILSHWEYQELNRCVRFILGVRNHLHRLSGRRNDRLHFHRQARLAPLLGYRDRDGIMAVERFLGDLHAAMASVKSIYRTFVSTHLEKNPRRKKHKPLPELPAGITIEGGSLHFVSATRIAREPMLMLKICERCAATGRPLSLEARRLVREFLHLVDESFRRRLESTEVFLKMLTHSHAFDALEQMLETGLLAAFVPEFSDVQNRVQFDAYHTFPVGRHLIETVRMLKSAGGGNHFLLLTIFSEIGDPSPLLLAALFHDLGKVGPGHAVLGVDITGRVLDRMGCSKEARAEVLFLVRCHLLLAETATRRDLGDEKVVVQCAQAIENVERLKMLYLLTWADSAATGPRAWNPWKANLVEELFFKVLHILETGEMAGPDASDLAESTFNGVRARLAGTMDENAVRTAFENMPPRYLLSVGAADICRHLELHGRLRILSAEGRPAAAVIEAVPDPEDGTWEVVVAAGDRAGLFADLAGVLTLNGIDVLSAHVYTWRDRTAVDIFRVSRPPDALNPWETWRRVEKDLNRAASGDLALSREVAGKRSTPILPPANVPPRPPRVTVDNDQSDFFTIIEVFADDKPGVLFDLAETLFQLRLDIRVARAATHADQIADVFYVCDIDGGKVEGAVRILEIKDTLLRRIVSDRQA